MTAARKKRNRNKAVALLRAGGDARADPSDKKSYFGQKSVASPEATIAPAQFVLWLKARGLSNEAAATAFGLGPHAIYQYANGLRKVHGAVARLMQYIDAYGVMQDDK